MISFNVMKKKGLVISVCFLFILVIVYIISLINGNERYQSYAFNASGPAVGFVLGSLIHRRKLIIDRKKFKLDLLVLLSGALVGSALLCILLESGKILGVSVISLNAVMIIIFLLRNIKNIRS